MKGVIKGARRLARKLDGKDLSRHAVCAWQVPGAKEWRIQSRVPSVSHYLRSCLKLPRVGYSVLGGHLNIFKVTRRNAGSWAKRFVNTYGGTVLE